MMKEADMCSRIRQNSGAGSDCGTARLVAEFARIRIEQRRTTERPEFWRIRLHLSGSFFRARRVNALAVTGLLLLATLLTGCAKKLIGVDVYVVDDKTRLEQEVLGTYDELGSRTLYVPSLWITTEPGAPAPRGNRAALQSAVAEVKQALANERSLAPAKRRAGDECRLLLNLGALHSSLAQWLDAQRAFGEAAGLAAKHRLLDLAWKIKLETALAAFQQNADRPALLKNLRETAEALKGIPPVLCRDDGASRRARRTLYSRLALLESEAKSWAASFMSVERLATREILQVLGSARVPMADPSEREMAEMAYELRDELRRLAKRLDALPADSRALPSTADEFDETLAEYRETIAPIAETSYALAALFSPEPPSLLEVQESLAEDTALIRCSQFGSTVLVSVVTSEALVCKAVPAPAARLSSASPQEISRIVIQPVAGALHGIRRLYVLADDTTIDLPWYDLVLKGDPLIASKQIAFEISLGHHMSAHSRRNLFRRSLFVCTPPGGLAQTVETAREDFRTLTLLPETSSQIDKFVPIFRRHHCALLPQTFRVNRGQILSSYLEIGRGRSPHSPTLAEIVGVPLNSAAIFLGGARPLEGYDSLDTRTIGALAVLTAQAGCPSIVTRRGPPVGAPPGELLGVFFKTVAVEACGQALHAAQRLALERRIPREQWACFRIYGSLGMNEEEGLEFADAHYEEYVQHAVDAQAEKRWPDVIRHCEAAIALMDVIDLDEGRDRVYDALCLASYRLGKFDEAARWQLKLRKLYRDLEQPVAAIQSTQTLGAIYLEAGDYTEALTFLTEAVKSYEANPELPDAARRRIQGYAQLGAAQENTGRYAEALKTFRSLLRMSQDLKAPTDVASQHARIGRVYYLRLNDYAQAVEHFQKALGIYEKQNDKKNAAQMRLRLGLVHEKLGSYDDARREYGQALALAKETHDRLTEAQARIYFANTYWFQGDYHKAFVECRASLRIAREVESQRQEIIALNTLGLIHWTQNDYDRSLEALRQALGLAKAARIDNEIATTHNNLGLVFREQGEFAEALQQFRAALEIDVRLRSRWGRAYSRRNMGMTHLRMKQPQAALEHLHAAATLSKQIGNRINLLKALQSIGDAQLQLRDMDEARETFERALKLSQKMMVGEITWRAHSGLARVATDQGDKQVAFDHLAAAIERIEELRASIKIEEFRNGFLSNKLDVYEDMIRMLLDNGRTEEAFNYAERSRAKSFIDLLGAQRISMKSQGDQRLYDKHTYLKKEMRVVEERIGRADPAQREALRKTLLDLRKKYADLLIDMRAANPQLSSFVTVDSLKLKDVQQLLKPEVALLEFLVTKDELVTWVVKSDAFHVVRQDIDAKHLEARVLDYRRLIQHMSDLEGYPEDLYDSLIRPVEKHIRGARYLGIVPHGVLHYMSFSSLHDGESYLIDRYAIFHSPSASVLKFTLARKPDAKAAAGKVRVLAIGNPNLGSAAYDLPFAEKEVKSLRWNFPKIDILTRDRATESWVVKHIGEYGIIHIASHGEFDSVSPLFSALKLRADPQADGNLRANEVTELRLNAQLVTLSACQTGLGKIEKGDEVIGLNRAFIYAGTRAIVSSLWRVSDVSTAIMIKHFYRNYVAKGKADSLAEAQRQVKRFYPHPSYWAGFALTGDYE